MSERRDIGSLLDDWLRAEAPAQADAVVLVGAMERIGATDQRRAAQLRLFGDRYRWASSLRFATVTALLVLALVLAAVFTGALRSEPPPILWTPERLTQDWPAPPRPEPGEGAPDVSLVLGAGAQWDASEQAWEGWEYVDPVGDIGAEAGSWVDIRRVGYSGGRPEALKMNLAGDVRLPATDPTDRWIAYGFVIDTDADGIPDIRLGMDNLPGGAYRWWGAYLTTGQLTTKCWPKRSENDCESSDRGPRGLTDAYYPYTEEIWSAGPWFFYSGPSGRFYAWASQIEGGRVVATDYAPDAGWLVVDKEPGLPLIGTTWSIEREFPDRSLLVVMSLVFTADGRLQLDLCRRGEAKVQVTQNAERFDALRVTDIDLSGDACSAEVAAMEEEVLAVLSGGDIAYTLESGILELRAAGHVLRLTGTTEPPPG